MEKFIDKGIFGITGKLFEPIKKILLIEASEKVANKQIHFLKPKRRQQVAEIIKDQIKKG